MDKDMIMNNFLAATGIEDFGNALSILEQNDWDLLASVNSVIPQDFQSSACQQQQQQPTQQQEQLQQYKEQLGDDFTMSPLLRFPEEESELLHPGGDFISKPLSSTRLHRTVGPDMPILPNPIVQARTKTHRNKVDQPMGMTDDEKMGPLHNHSDTNSMEVSDSTVMEETSRESVCYKDNVSSEGKQTNQNGHNPSDEEGSEYYSPEEDFEHHDLEEESDVSLPPTVQHGSLIPDNCSDPRIALQLFADNFEQRYGSLHPLFYVGTLAEALKEASSPLLPNLRKPLLVYLHHDRSILSNIFCSQLLCAESVVNLLSANYISWGWDLTSDSQKRILLDMVKESFGEQTASSVESVKSDHLPVILLVCKVGGKLEVQNIIQGNTDIESFMGHLLTCMEIHGEQVQRDNIEEQARIERERMIEEQDRRYRESLEADRLKEEKRIEAERLKVQEQEEKEAERRRCSNAVPLEPLEDYEGKMAKVRFRCPNGETMMRRFRAEETLGMLLNFLGSESYPVGKFKLLTSFPRRDISELDPEETFDSLGLCPQATLFIEEK